MTRILTVDEVESQLERAVKTHSAITARHACIAIAASHETLREDRDRIVSEFGEFVKRADVERRAAIDKAAALAYVLLALVNAARKSMKTWPKSGALWSAVLAAELVLEKTTEEIQ